VGWLESGWRQFTPSGRPLVSPDFGYGIMQVTSGMAGAGGNPRGTIAARTQTRIVSNYAFNVAYGAAVLERKWAATPQVGTGDPTILEDWYYALWAYNGWGWMNNPNNPRFTRQGSPSTDPANFPYQDRVLYLVAHPPRDRDGNPLWQPVPVALPSRKAIGRNPGPLPETQHPHAQPPASLGAVYQPGALPAAMAGATLNATVRITNTGTQPWPASGDAVMSLAYHVFTGQGNPWQTFSPFSNGVIAFGQHPVPLGARVAPGQSVMVRTVVQVPTTPGAYRIVWDLEQGASVWLSQVGVLPHAQVLAVGRAGAPPTPAPSPTATPVGRPQGLQYVADTSVPDGTVVRAGSSFAKGWLVWNDGPATWTSGWHVQRTSGAFGRRSASVPHTLPCHSALIVLALRAPSRAGTFKATWRLFDPSNHPVGEKLTTMIRVQSNGPKPTPTPLPKPSPRPSPPAPTATPVG
jgi:hypothetical protein